MICVRASVCVWRHAAVRVPKRREHQHNAASGAEALSEQSFRKFIRGFQFPCETRVCNSRTGEVHYRMFTSVSEDLCSLADDAITTLLVWRNRVGTVRDVD
jgi:hypothetical protein